MTANAKETTMITADQLTFGVEIECQIPVEVIQREDIRNSDYRHGHQVQALPCGWVSKYDSSIDTRRVAGTVYYGVEIVSPVLEGEEGVKEVTAVLKQLREWGCRVDQS